MESQKNADLEDDYHSASDSFHGNLQHCAALLTVRAVAYACLHHRAKSENRASGHLLLAEGLPPLRRKRKGSATDVVDENLLNSVAGLQTPSMIVPYDEEPSSTSSTALPSRVGELRARKRKPALSDEGRTPAFTNLASEGDFQRSFQGDRESEQSMSKEEIELPNDGEGLSYSPNRRSDSLFSSNRYSVVGEHDDISRETSKDTENFDTLTLRSLPDDLLQYGISSSSDYLKSQSSRSEFFDQGKKVLLPSGMEYCEIDDRVSDLETNNALTSSQDNIIPNDGTSSLHSKWLLGGASEDSHINGSSEQRQPDSLLLWPFGLAVEAVAFQLRLIVQAFSLVAMVYDWFNSFASNRVRETLQAKDKATEALSQKVALMTTVPPKFTEGGSAMLKRAGWGCLAASYVCLVLSILLFSALVLDYAFLSQIVEEPVSVKEKLHFDYTEPNPTAIVSLQPFGGKLGSSAEYARPLSVSQKVHVTVFLTLPESEYNRNLGIFQLTTELLSETGKIIKSSSRPCILRFYSFPIRVVKTFLISLPSLLGMFSESQTLKVHMMEFEEQPTATHTVKILVQAKAGMPLGQGIPEIYSAHVHIESHLPWLKNTMRNWKWTVYIWTGLAFYVIEILMILCCCRQALLPTLWLSRNDQNKKDETESKNSENMDEGHGSRSGHKKEHLSTQLHSPYEHIPTARAVIHRRDHRLIQDGPTSASSPA